MSRKVDPWCGGAAFGGIGRGSYNGVAVAARDPISDVRSSGAMDDDHLDREPRLISAVVHRSTHVTPAERAALGRLLDAGLVDVDVARWGPRARRFTWWNHGIGYSRNLGMRLDMIATDPDLAARLETTWIDHTERGGDHPSDHAALIADFHVDHADGR